MKARQVRSVAARWVARHARPELGYRGAYFSGSTVGLPDENRVDEVTRFLPRLRQSAEDILAANPGITG